MVFLEKFSHCKNMTVAHGFVEKIWIVYKEYSVVKFQVVKDCGPTCFPDFAYYTKKYQKIETQTETKGNRGFINLKESLNPLSHLYTKITWITLRFIFFQ